MYLHKPRKDTQLLKGGYCWLGEETGQMGWEKGGRRNRTDGMCWEYTFLYFGL